MELICNEKEHYAISGEPVEPVKLKPKEPIEVPVELRGEGRPDKPEIRIMAEWEVALEVWDAQPNGVIMAAEVPAKRVRQEKKKDEKYDEGEEKDQGKKENDKNGDENQNEKSKNRKNGEKFLSNENRVKTSNGFTFEHKDDMVIISYTKAAMISVKIYVAVFAAINIFANF